LKPLQPERKEHYSYIHNNHKYESLSIYSFLRR
jgi:hypothetical protein